MTTFYEEARADLVMRAQNSRNNQHQHAKEGQHFVGEETSRARAEAYEYAIEILDRLARKHHLFVEFQQGDVLEPT